MNYYEFIKKTFSRILICTLIAGLAAPYSTPYIGQADNTAVYAVEASASDLFISNPLENTRCSLYTDGEKSFKMGGRTYYQGIVMGDGSYQNGSEISYNVEGTKSISFSLGHIDNSNIGSAEFSIYLDDILEDKFTLSYSQPIQEYEVNTTGASKLRIVKTGNYSKYALANVTVDDNAPANTFTIPQYKTSAAFLESGYDSVRSYTYDGTNTQNFFMLNGRQYYQGIVMGDGSYEDNAAFSVNVENLKTISFTLGHVDNSSSNSSEFHIYVDNVLEDKFTLSQNEPLRDYTIDVSKAKTLRIFRNGDYSQYALADITVDELAPKNSCTVPAYKNSAAVIGGIYDNYRTKTYDGISSSVYFNMAGRRYHQGIILGDGSYDENSAFSLNVENLNTISFDLGHVDNSDDNNCELYIYLDNKLIDTIKMKYASPIYPYTLDVSEASTLRIFRNGNYSKYALGDITADELKPKNTHIVPEFISNAKFVDSVYDNIRATKYIDDNKFTFFKMNGVEYTQGITIGNNSYDEYARAAFNVEKLDSVSFTLGHVDETKTTSAVLKVYLDNKLFKTIDLTTDMIPQEYTFDVSGASSLLFVKDNGYATYGLGNFKVKESSGQVKPPVTSAPAVTAPPVVTTKAPAVTTAPQNPTTKPKGDLNGDGDLTTSDVRILLQALVGSYKLTDEGKVLADVDGDGNLTSTDALRLLRYIIGSSDSL